MRKVFRKLFSNSSSDGVNEKSSKKLLQSRNRISVPNLINQVELSKLNAFRADDVSIPGSTSVEVYEEGDTPTPVISHTNHPRGTSLHTAVSVGNAELVKELLALGGDAETRDEDGLTPFLKAVKIGNVELVNIMAPGSKLQTDVDGNTALHIAVKQEFLRIVEILVNHDPLVNVPNKAGDLPLHIAVSKECFSIVELLLKNNAVMDVRGSQKKTPLYIAVKLENIPLIHLLLKYGAYKNDQSIVTCVSSSRNSKIKTLFGFLDYKETTSASVVNDDDSQKSELSCTLPPVLNSPRSWNILHPKRNDKSHNTDDNVSNLLPYKRRKNFRKADISKPRNFNESPLDNIVDVEKSDSLANDEKAIIEDCKKALNELSLQVSQNESVSSQDRSNESTKFLEISSFFSNSPSTEKINSLDNVENNYNQKYKLGENTYSSAKITGEYSSSSDEEPLMWENSNDGGYFTEWSSKLSDANEIENRSKSSSSEEELDNLHHNKVYSAVLTSLKQVTQDNKDLETESAVLRESVEKLKYDLANCREDVDTEKINSSSLLSHFANFDEKYLKAVENVGTSQLYISNLEKEISHLKRTFNESCKMNRFLAKELRKALTEITQIKSIKCQTCEDRRIQIGELQAEIVEWRNKYDDLIRSSGEKNSTGFHYQDLLDLHSEINHSYDKIKRCIGEANISKVSDSRETVTEEGLCEIMDKIESKIYLYLSEILKTVEEKAADCLSESIHERTEEIMKQKLFLEVSKLNSIIKDKEVREEQLKSQVFELREEMQKSKREKRNMLIRKTFRDKCCTNVSRRNSKDAQVNHDSHWK